MHSMPIILLLEQRYNKEIISKLSNLKYIFRLGSGTDNVDIKFLEKRKLVLKNQKLHLKFQ